MQPRSPTTLSFGVACLGIAFFSVMDALMKALTLAIGAYNAMFWRMLALTAMAGIAYLAAHVARGGSRPSRAAMGLHFVRGAVSAALALLFFWGLARVPLAQGVALSFIAPLIALYMAALILKERISRRAIYASLLGFAGVIVILAGQAQAKMGPDAFRGALAILVSAMLYAWNIILMRQQAQVAGPFEIAFYNSLFIGLCYLPAAPFLAEPPPLAVVPGLIGAATLAFVSVLLLSWAYARAEAQHLAPVEYTAFIWASLLGLAMFGEPIRLLTLTGAAMIVGACLIAARRRHGPIVELEAAL